MQIDLTGDNVVDSVTSQRMSDPSDNKQKNGQGDSNGKNGGKSSLSPRMKLIVSAVVVVAILSMGIMIVKGIKRSVGSGEVTQVAVKNVLMPKSKADTQPKTTDVEEQATTEMEQLRQENIQLKAQLQELKEELDPTIANMPASVTRISDFKKNEPTALNSTNTRMFKELVPYQKQYITLPSGDYSFSILVSYGSQQYLLPITHRDYLKMRPEGVMSVEVEVTEVKDNDSGSRKQIVTFMGLDIKWENNISPR